MILLWVLAGLVGLVFLLCLVKIRITAKIQGTDMTVDLAILGMKIRLLPSQQKPKKEEKKSREPAAEQKKVILKEQLSSISRQDIRDAWDILFPVVKKTLRRLGRGVRIDPLRVSLTLGGREDPSQTAKRYGELHAAVWTVMPALEQVMVIPDPQIHIGMDFDEVQTIAEGNLGISARIGTLLQIGLGAAVPALRWFLQFRKKKASQPETAAAHT